MMILHSLSSSCRRCHSPLKAHWNFCENCGFQLRQVSLHDVDSDTSSEVMHIAQIDKVSKHYASTQKKAKKLTPVEATLMSKSVQKKVAPEQVKLVALEHKNAQMVLDYEYRQRKQQMRRKIAGVKDKPVPSTVFPKLKSVGYLDALPSVIEIQEANKKAALLQPRHPSPAARRKQEDCDMSPYKKEEGWYWGHATEERAELPKFCDGVFWGEHNDYYKDSDTDEETLEKSESLGSFDVGDVLQSIEVDDVSAEDTEEASLLQHLHIGQRYTASIKQMTNALRSTFIDYRRDPMLCVGESNPIPYYTQQLSTLEASLQHAQSTIVDITHLAETFHTYCDKKRQQCALAIAVAQENCEVAYEKFNMKYEQIPHQIKKDKSGQPDPYLLKTAQAKFQTKVDAKMTELGDKLHALVAEEARIVATLKNAEAKVEKCFSQYHEKHAILINECHENINRLTYILQLTAARKIKRLVRLYFRHKQQKKHLDDDFYEVVVTAMTTSRQE